MKTGLRWCRGLPLAALALFTCAAIARPLLIPPQNLAVPQLPGAPPHLEPIYGKVAIDAGTLLVGASRAINEQNDRSDAVHIFQRNTEGRWAYAGILAELGAIELKINGAIAAVRHEVLDGITVYERGPTGWAQSGTIPSGASQLVRIDDGSIYVQPVNLEDYWACVPPFQEFRKVNGTWTQVATIGGQRCDDARPDINEGRALIVHTPRDGGPYPQSAEIFARASPTWNSIGNIAQPPPTPPVINFFGRDGTIRGDTAYIDRGYFYRYSGGAWVPAARLFEPEVELRPDSYEGKLRGHHLFLRGEERDYQVPTTDPEVSQGWRVLRAYRQTASGGFVYHARLNADFDVWGWSVSDDGRQVAAFGANFNDHTYSESLRLYVFEVPDTVSFPGTQQDTFNSGNYSRWTATAGSFAVVPSGVTRVLRQSSLAAEAGAHLTAIDWTDQSIEADLRPLEFAGAGRWFGLVTRRTDAQNYYYVTLRSPNIISIRRMLDGVYTELAWTYATAPFQPGRNYRVRFESVGDQHAVFIDGFPQLHIKDRELTRGHPGVAGYRTRFDVDNVTVSGGTRLLLRLDGRGHYWSDGWQSATGTWQLAGGMRQTDNQADARWVSKAAVNYQVVSTRVRPQSHGTGSDPWIGLAARVVDDSNYYYITLRRSQQLSLRRLVNGQIQVLATVPQALTLGAWHDLRLEVIGTHIRAYVNGDLRIETTDSTLAAGGGGRNALLMYKTAADVESYSAYQP